ncbi:MAG TPA: CmpA/NrtA family ABC transporter substrate-binding protein [Opitutaceae bacterium]
MSARPKPRPRPLRVGFLPLTDAAPLVVAQVHGLFARRGIAVELRREVGWATIREKVRLGELDAAHAPAPMLWAMALGIGCPPTPVSTAFILGENGNALTLATAIGQEARTPEGVREIARRRREAQPLTLATVYSLSSHVLLIHEWARRCGLSAERDIRIAVIPPGQMYRNLVAGTIDGYAAGEPWNTLAVNAGAGWCPVWSSGLGPPQAEKVLLVTERFAETRGEEHAALVSGLSEAAQWCDSPASRPQLAAILSGPRYLSVPSRLVAPSLSGRFDPGHGGPVAAPDFHVFHRGGANAPSAAKASELQAALVRGRLIPDGPDPELPGRLFREDIYAQALAAAGHAGSPRP